MSLKSDVSGSGKDKKMFVLKEMQMNFLRHFTMFVLHTAADINHSFISGDREHAPGKKCANE